MNDNYRMLTKIVRNMKLEKAKEQDELNDNENEALRYIIKHPGCISNDVADYLNVDKGLVARIVQKLMKMELIVLVSGEDKRKKHLTPTDKALAYKDRNQSFEIKYYRQLFVGIPLEEQEVFFKTLRKVYLESKKIRKQNREKRNEEKI